MSRTSRIIAIVASVAVLVALFVLLRPGDEEPDGDASPTTPSATTTAPTETPGVSPTTEPPSPTPTVTEIEVAYANGEVSGPDRVEVDRGERVRIVVTSDVPEEVHLHGYDLTADVGPGSPGEIEFVANASGQFEVELEGSHTELFTLVVGA